MPLLKPDLREPENAPVPITRDTEQRARMAQVLLVARLKARTRRDLAVDSLERAAHVIFVTCKSWFSAPFSKAPSPPATASPADPAPDHPPLEKNHDSHAHRNH
jgi:hypothetical protein